MSLTMSSPGRRPVRWLAAAALALALLHLQTLGLLHRVAHAPSLPVAVASGAAWHGVAESERHAARSSPAGDWNALFQHPAQGEDCRLFDQLLLADLVLDAADSAVPRPADTAAAGALLAPRAAAARRAHQARAPPRSA